MTGDWKRQPVGVVGLGLIGGSLALDLGAAGIEVRALVHRETTAARARQRGLAAAVSTDPSILRDCTLVVLALPLDRLLAPDPSLLAALPAAAVVTDVGSVKGPVLSRWRSVRRFVGSHPMAGTAQAGVEAGQRRLFQGRPWVATPEPATEPGALQVVRELAETVEGCWLCCPAEAHDRAVALISHLPVLASAALLQAADRGAAAHSDEEIPELVRALASSGFADTSRVGGGNPELGTLMARANRPALLDALAHYRAALEGLEELVRAGEWQALRQELELCRSLRPGFLRGDGRGGRGRI